MTSLPSRQSNSAAWRVMRFENAEGKWAEVASNHVGPEEIRVPPGYRFISSTPMVPAEQAVDLADAIERFMQQMDALENPRPAQAWFDLKDALKGFQAVRHG